MKKAVIVLGLINIVLIIVSLFNEARVRDLIQMTDQLTSEMRSVESVEQSLWMECKDLRNEIAEKK